MYRIVPVRIWEMPEFEDWTFIQKAFYVYLLTSHLTNTAGLFMLAKKHMMVDTGIPRDEIQELLDFMESKGEIVINEDRNEAWLTRFVSFQSFNGSVLQRVGRLIAETESQKIQAAYNKLYNGKVCTKKLSEKKKVQPPQDKTPERKISEYFPPKETKAMIGTMKRFLKSRFPDFVDYAFETEIMQRAKETGNPVAYVMGIITKPEGMSQFNQWRSKRGEPDGN